MAVAAILRRTIKEEKMKFVVLGFYVFCCVVFGLTLGRAIFGNLAWEWREMLFVTKKFLIWKICKIRGKEFSISRTEQRRIIRFLGLKEE